MRTQDITFPLISIVLPVYNAEPFLAETILSIQAQTHSHFELIAVDDGSTDASPQVLEDFAARDARIRPVFLSHGGQSMALNAGVAFARGEFIAYMDHDDIALPHRLETQLAWMLEQRVDLCGGWLRRFGDRNGFLWFPVTHEAICMELLFRVALHHGTSMIRTEIARAHRFDEQVSLTDYEMLTRLAPCCRLGNVPRILLKHRRHSGQAQEVYRTEFLNDLRKYRRRHFFNLFPEAKETDYRTIARVADREPFSTLEELERAGGWLARPARTPDTFLRQRMARRWLAACLASAHLGPACYRLYREIANRFEVAAVDPAFRLRLACAARVRSGSRIYAVAGAVKRAVGRKRGGNRSRTGSGSNAEFNASDASNSAAEMTKH